MIQMHSRTCVIATIASLILVACGDNSGGDTGAELLGPVSVSTEVVPVVTVEPAPAAAEPEPASGQALAAPEPDTVQTVSIDEPVDAPSEPVVVTATEATAATETPIPPDRVSSAQPTAEAPAAPGAEVPPELEPPTDLTPDDNVTSSESVDPEACVANTVSSLSSCIQAARSNTLERDDRGIAHIALSSDITCDGNCCPSGQALLNLSGTNSIELNGGSFRILRRAGQRSCSLLTAHNASNITVSNIVLDDDETVAACSVTDRCPRMLHMSDATNVALLNSSVRFSKGYAIYVRASDGFRFEDSTLENSGVLGLYIGHEDDSSRNVTVARSRFSDNSTNALALLGVTGPVVITDNVFERNHAFGQWPVAPRFGTGMTGGGQVYIARASGVRMENNRVVDGYCNNCYIHNRLGTGVTGIELGKPGARTVSDILINNNVIENNDAYAVAANTSSPIDNSVRVTNNRLRSNGGDWRLEGAVLQGNSVLD